MRFPVDPARNLHNYFVNTGTKLFHVLLCVMNAFEIHTISRQMMFLEIFQRTDLIVKTVY